MLFFQKIVRAGLTTAATVLAGNTITFVSQNRSPRTVYFTSNPGFANIDDVHVPGGASVAAPIPWGWEGNAYTAIGSRPVVPSMLMEVAYNKAHGNGPTSSCGIFPCGNAYYHPDDIQTKSTQQTDLIVILVSTHLRDNKATVEPLQGFAGPTNGDDDDDDTEDVAHSNSSLSRHFWRTGGPQRIRQ
ncbi:hypothetical protein MMYC01_203637 [Madurella mycetomatis]|uniref:Uncharacterized protein n=1 Tax=Madurella mycetomatis TaxID=100816 RepID=A0A175W5M4_9PEZI|nr:hypothetical protein MMYC01_203637 [Madurella mycetomatis]